MDRRTFLCETGGALFAVACDVAPARGVRGAFTGESASAYSCIALFDPALAQGRALAHYAARKGIEAWPADDDIGMLWHARLARYAERAECAGARTRMIAALRPSDQFVLARLAAPSGAVVLMC
ncbi:MAG: hypothetical protein EPN70_22400 [Paraburkholderia sp.]|uniref:hypothetical protein n=1 Tax=Paraburkholderia sp. TaxID=1926495 RepID=UPI0011F9465A|nr:hypothetical protein [Paraburkholderia sp.]TAM00418.1 MAG: hypothetical protein EPN70_22400 [Paraburkholderia sp.]TAM31323.1 MAG: hypothetical protein EPN59_06500 [Paraburkholderia sp.]